MAKVLFVDDEPNFLRAVERLFDPLGQSILTAGCASEALMFLEHEEISVLVTDQRMPVTPGTELVKQARQVSPKTVRIIMSGQSDLPDILDAINEGGIYKFLLKPGDMQKLPEIVAEAQKHYIEKIVDGGDKEQMILALAEAIELKDIYTSGHCQRVAEYSLAVADRLGVSADEQRDICYGAWLHDCGKIGISEAILNYDGKLSPGQYEIIKRHAEWGSKIVSKGQFSDGVINIVLLHHERIDGKGYPIGLVGDAIPIGARIVAVADCYDALSTDRPYRHALRPWRIAKILESLKNSALDSELVSLLGEITGFNRA